MSIEPGLHYDQKSDKIDGFVNCGDGMRKALADHAMVFMARGMSAPDIVRNIKEIILSLKEIGLCYSI
ncbi:hypothetical protein QE152_g18102 [Popillia japonica]|uniref:Transposable element P transposase-like RNase H domain-containing protein n=1 Tax=Popillia japonica TaxID=7064 RepID=A0AAW1L4N7_POPJA